MERDDQQTMAPPDGDSLASELELKAAELQRLSERIRRQARELSLVAQRLRRQANQ